MKKRQKIKIKLVLSGSGAKGSYQYGFIKELMKDDKYEIVKIFGSSIGSLNSLLLSKGDFDNFWENYHMVAPSIINNNKIFNLYKYYLGETNNDKKWVNLIENQILLWQKTENTIPFSLSQKVTYKTDIYNFNNETKNTVPPTFLNKYLKDIILNSNIYEQYDETYWHINNNNNEYAPVKNIIDDSMNSDKCIYIVLSLQSEDNIIDCFPTNINLNDENFEKDMDYITYLYKYHINYGQNIQNYNHKKYSFFDNNLMFIYNIEHQLLNNSDYLLPEYIQNCIENGKYHFEIFNTIITDNYENLFKDTQNIDDETINNINDLFE
jgi:hypothetical protein